MDKDELITKLAKAGYIAKEENGVVMVIVCKDVDVQKQIQNLEAFVNETGYRGSYGIRAEHQTVES